jgi:hypothetical protein
MNCDGDHDRHLTKVATGGRRDGGKIGKTVASPSRMAGCAQAAEGAPNILSCCSTMSASRPPAMPADATPSIDAIAARGLRYTGFHTT